MRRLTALILSAVGGMFLMAYLAMTPVGAMELGAPALQPSPRPPWNATMTAPAGPTPALTLSSPTPVLTPTPIPVLLPPSGVALPGQWLLVVGIILLLLGALLTVLGRIARPAN